MKLETTRLRLRPLVPSDLEQVLRINGEPQVAAWLGGPISAEASRAMLLRQIDHQARWGFSVWAAELKGARDLVGLIGLQRLAADHALGQGVEMVWRLDPAFWGQGLATEGARAALDWARNHLTGEIYAFTAASNLASRAVMERIGLHRAAELDFLHPALAADHPLRPHVVYRAQGGGEPGSAGR